jgi:hypothetical protein
LHRIISLCTHTCTLSPAAERKSCQLYYVQQGDFLYGIAGKLGIINASEIIDLNPTLASGLALQPGSAVKIPPWSADCGEGVVINGAPPGTPSAAGVPVPLSMLPSENGNNVFCMCFIPATTRSSCILACLNVMLQASLRAHPLQPPHTRTFSCPFLQPAAHTPSTPAPFSTTWPPSTV